MTAPLIAPLIPPRGRPGSREHGRPTAARRLPLPSRRKSRRFRMTSYGFGRMDESGRVADRAMTSVLGWQAGDRLTLTAAAGVVIARREPGGMVTMPSKPYLVIPAALRRRCGLRPGDRMLLAVPGLGGAGRVPSLSVTLAIGITSRPTFDPAPVGHAGADARYAAGERVQGGFGGCHLLGNGVVTHQNARKQSVTLTEYYPSHPRPPGPLGHGLRPPGFCAQCKEP